MASQEDWTYPPLRSDNRQHPRSWGGDLPEKLQWSVFVLFRVSHKFFPKN